MADDGKRVRDALEPLPFIWSGLLGKVSMNSHRIEGLMHSTPHPAHPYINGLKYWKAQDQDVKRKIQLEVIELSTFEQASPCYWSLNLMAHIASVLILEI